MLKTLLFILFYQILKNVNSTSERGKWKEVEDKVEMYKPINLTPCRPGTSSKSILIVHDRHQNIHTVRDGNTGKPAFDPKNKKPDTSHEKEHKTEMNKKS